MIEKAIKFAAERHGGQVDKGGQPYILHCLRVMFRVRTGGGTEAQQVAAVLHDVLEDTKASSSQLIKEFGPEVHDLVWALTRVPGTNYEEYIGKVAQNPLAGEIKLADLADNLDPARHGWAKGESSTAKLNKLKHRYQSAVLTLESLGGKQ